MPVDSHSIRERSAVGRFPTVTFGFAEDTEEEKEGAEEHNAATENACRRWLRKVCPCCCPTPDDDDNDITDTLVTGIDDGKDDAVNGEKPGDGYLNGMAVISDSVQYHI